MRSASISVAPGAVRTAGPGRRVVLPLVLLAVAMRAVAILRTELVAVDSMIFLDAARDFARGDFASALAPNQHPLHAAWIALWHLAGLPILAAGAAAVLSASALMAWGVVRLAWLALGERAAWVAGVFYAFHPIFLRGAGDLLSETTYLPLALWAVLLVLPKWRESPGWRWAGAGFLAGLAYLDRQDALAAGVGLTLCLAAGLFRGRRTFLQAARGASVFWVCFVFAAAPYIAYLSLDAGELMISRKKKLSDFWKPVAERFASLSDTKRPADAGSGVTEAPGAPDPSAPSPKGYAGPDWGSRELWAGWGQKILDAFPPAVFLGPFLIGVLSAWRERRKWTGDARDVLAVSAGLSLFHGAICLALLHQAGTLEKRHLLWIVALTAPVTALGFIRMADGLAWLGNRKARGGSVLAAAMGLYALACLPSDLSARRAEPEFLALRRLGEWLEAQPLPAGKALVSGEAPGHPEAREPTWIVFYAGRRYDRRRFPEWPGILASPGAKEYALVVGWGEGEGGFRPPPGWRRIDPPAEIRERLEEPVLILSRE